MRWQFNYKFLFFSALVVLGVPFCVSTWFLYKDYGTTNGKIVRWLEYEAASTCAKADQLWEKFQKEYPGKLDDSNKKQKEAWGEYASYSQACDENRAELVNALMIKYGFAKVQ